MEGGQQVKKDLQLRDRIVWLHDNQNDFGWVMWNGKLTYDGVLQWMVGIELDHPVGNDNHYFGGRTLFECKPNHAQLVPARNIQNTGDYIAAKATSYSRVEMEEAECMVCFTEYDDNRRPRSLPCGHTMCSKCLEQTIRDDVKMCPKCRTHYSADNLTDIPINFSLETILKSLSISKNTNTVKLAECLEKLLPVSHIDSRNAKEKSPECAEHLLPVSLRCATHKAWICQSCVVEDHSSESCQIISIAVELSNKKSRQLNMSKPFLTKYEESCKKAEDCQIQYEKLNGMFDGEITRFESKINILQEEIKAIKNIRMQMEEKNSVFDKNLNIWKDTRSFYDEAVTSLKSSETIREVSVCSVEVQTKAEQLKLVSQEIEKEVQMMTNIIFDVQLKAEHQGKSPSTMPGSQSYQTTLHQEENNLNETPGTILPSGSEQNVDTTEYPTVSQPQFTVPANTKQAPSLQNPNKTKKIPARKVFVKPAASWKSANQQWDCGWDASYNYDGNHHQWDNDWGASCYAGNPNGWGGGPGGWAVDDGWGGSYNNSGNHHQSFDDCNWGQNPVANAWANAW